MKLKIDCDVPIEFGYRKGANAVEVDVTFGTHGDPLYTYHGPPCDCWRHCHQQEDFNEYLNYVREIAIDDEEGIGKNLSLLFLDLKLDYLDQKSKGRAGVELAKSIVGNLFLDSQASIKFLNENSTISNRTITKPKRLLRLVLSVNHVTDTELINNFLHYLEQNNSTNLLGRIGFDVGMNDDIQAIESMWRRFGTNLNIWQGDGYTNCFSPFYNLERLSKALVKRDAEKGYPLKVYHWTIDLHDRMRESLMMGVDAVMTNHPERLLAVLNEPEIVHNFRLANRQDDPFKKIVQRANARVGESARYQRSTRSVNGGFIGGFMDVLASWFTYLKEIPYLSLPTTSRFMPRVKRQKQTSMNSAGGKGNQPEYRVDGTKTAPNVSDPLKMSPTTGGLNSSNPDERVPDFVEPYEGPKWYTSFFSNLLVSMMKIILPAQ